MSRRAASFGNFSNFWTWSAQMAGIPAGRMSFTSFCAIVLALGLLLAGTTGRLALHRVPDSASYENYPLSSGFGAMASHIRTPGYPLLLAAVRSITGSLDLMPYLQWLGMFAAAGVFAHALAAWGLAVWPRRVVLLSIGFGCTNWDHAATLSTDALTAALGVLTAAGLLYWARTPATPVTPNMPPTSPMSPTSPTSAMSAMSAISTSMSRGCWLSGIAVVLLATAAVSFRPAYLFLFPWIGLAGCLLRRLQGERFLPAVGQAGLLMAAAMVPTCSWCVARWVTVAEFGVAPFGGQNLAGVLVQLLSDEELRALPGEAGELAQAYLRQRDAAGLAQRWPAADPTAYMTWEQRWDDVTWLALVPALEERYGADAVLQHRGVQRFNLQLLQIYPQRYMVWLIKAARRGVACAATDICLHPWFLPIILAVGLAILLRAAAGLPLPGSSPPSAPLPRTALPQAVTPDAVTPDAVTPDAVTPLAVIAVSYFLAKTGLVILSSPPVGRFTDAAAIFMPALAGVVLVNSLRQCLPWGRRVKSVSAAPQA
jgi:hypothetical protein